MEPPTHDVLLVAARAAAMHSLLDQVRRRPSRGRCAFTLLVLVPPDAPGADEAADALLTEGLRRLAEAAGRPVLGIVEPVDAGAALERALAGGRFDEAIVSAPAEPWRAADLARAIARLGIPVTCAADPPSATSPRGAGELRGVPPEIRPTGAAAAIRPGAAREVIALPDGRAAALRAVAPDDAALVAAFVDGLSEKSAHRRFLGAKRALTRAELRYLTDVDHRDHEALLALDRRTGELVGVARYIRARERTDSAELAVVVGDAWQARGLGRVMLARLAQRARANGIRHGRAMVLADNEPALRVLGALGAPQAVRHGHVLELEVELDRRAPGEAA